MSSVTRNLMGKLFSKRKKSAGSSRPASAAAAMAAAAGGSGDDNVTFGASTLPDVTLQHSDAVSTVASVKPGCCVSGSKDMSVLIYDYINQKQEDRWTGHKGAITKVCFGSAANSIFSSSRDKTIKMWRKGSVHCLKEFLGHSLVVTAISLSEDNKYLCSGSRDNTVRIWDVETTACLRSNTIPQNLVTDVKFVPGASQVVQTGEDKEIRFFDLRTLEPVFSFPKKQYIQMCCDVSPDGNYVVSSSNGFSGAGCEVSLWDLRSRKLHQEMRGHHEAVEACLFLPDAEKSLIASASRDCSVRVWDWRSGVCQSECFISGCGPLTSLAANQDGRILVGSFNQGVQVLQLSDDNLIKTMHY